MSLDVSLYRNQKTSCRCEECGHVHECDHKVCVYGRNITHNLNIMASKAGIYRYLWRPEELGIKIAGELIEPLEKGLALLKSDPERFKQFDAPNGWGRYEDLVEFVEEYLDACKKYHDATVEVSR